MADIESPEWWRDRLLAKLESDRPALEKLWRYYRGAHPAPIENLPQEVLNAYWAMIQRSKANFMELVVNAAKERLKVNGFRLSVDSTDVDDQESWRIWQASKMDSQQKRLYTEVGAKGRAYLLVWQDATQELPRITVEDATQVYGEHTPGDPYALDAAVKYWTDDRRDVQRCDLYLPGVVYQWERPGLNGAWAESDAPIETGWDFVPVVPVYNSPSSHDMGVSDIEGQIPSQDRINSTLFGRQLAGWLAAYRQRTITGMKPQIVRDSDGEPVLDSDGNEQAVNPFKEGIHNVWMASSKDVKFSSLEVTNPDAYIKVIDQDVLLISVTSRTPRHYLVQEGQSPSGDAIKSAETGLVAKCRDKMDEFGEALEQTMRMARKISTGEDTPEDSEVIWANPEYRSEGELVDALLKMASLGVPVEVLWSRWGATPQEIRQWKVMDAGDALRASLRALPAAAAPIDATSI